jgi:hypothetical protein
MLSGVRAHFDVSTAATSMIFSIALVSFTLGVLLAPLLLARVPQHFRLALLAGLAALSLGLAGTSSGFARFTIAYGACFGFTAGLLYNHAVSLASASGRATLLVPVSVAAFGLGGAVFGPVQIWLMGAGWALWSVAPALACLILTSVLSLAVRPMPMSPSVNAIPRQTLTKPDRKIAQLWVIFAAGSCSGLIVLGLAAQLLPPGANGVGMASLAIFLATIGNTLGRLASSLSTKWFGPKRGLAGALVLSILTLGGLIFSASPGAVVSFLFAAALAYGVLAATMPLLVRAHVSDAAFACSFGWVFTGWGVAGLIGPWTAGWLLDVTGTVQISLIICMALAALSLILVLRMRQDKTPEQNY